MAVKKITKRWLSGNFSVVLILIAVLVLTVSLGIRTFYYNSTRQYLLSRADAVDTLLTGYAADSSVDFSSRLRKLVEDFEYKEKVELMAIGGDGQVYITSSGFQPDAQTEMPDYQNALTSSDGIGEYTGMMGGERVMALTSMSKLIGEDLSAMRYVVSLTRVDAQIFSIVVLAALLGVVILLIVLFSSSYFISSIINPISEVSSTAKQIAQGDFGVRLEVKNDDEIGELCTAINNMAEELSNAEKIKNDFISSVSHELRTPLTAIRGWGETLASAEDPDPATMRKGMKVIMDETERLSSMVEDLLDFSRMQSGRLVLEMQRLDAIAELSDAVLIFTKRAALEQKNLLYHEPELPAPVLADRNRLRQVFVNIIDNALKYSDANDSVTIRAEIGTDTLRIVVEDTGCGISNEDLPKIKNRFYKGHTNRRGSGIGLAVADEIVAMHGGTLKIDSVKNVGTTVTLTFPLAP